MVGTVGLSIAQPAATLAAAATLTPRTACSEIDLSAYAGEEDGLLYRCDLLNQLKARGLAISSTVGQQVLSELLHPLDTVLEISGEAALPKRALAYLFQEFPHAAQLINFYSTVRLNPGQANSTRHQKSNYQVIYTQPDRSQFFATNNRNMQAIVDIIDQLESAVSNNYLLFENGHAKLMFWRFTGKSIVELNLIKHGDQTTYKVKIHLFSSSQMYHAFFESALFAYLMRSMFKKIVGDIVDAARHLAESSDIPACLDPDFTAALLRQLK